MKHSGVGNHLGTTSIQDIAKNIRIKMSAGEANYQDWITSSVTGYWLRGRWVLDKDFARSEILIEEDPGTGVEEKKLGGSESNA